MQVSIESTGNLERKMTVRVPSERIDAEVQKRLRDLSKRVKLDGFRPGKVPFKLVQQRYGNSVYQDVVGEVVQSTLHEALAQEKLAPAGSPEIELPASQDSEELTYTATFEIYPEIELSPLGELDVSRPVAEVNDADVDAMIETLRKQRREWKPGDGAAQEGDQIVMDFKGTLNGEPFEGGEAVGYEVVLGEGRLINDFETQLMGVSAGDEKKIEVSFPSDYHAQDLAGKTAEFEIKIKEVNVPVLPEIDEEFVRSLGIDKGGIEVLREEVRKNMERELGNALKERVKSQVMDALFERNPIELPKSLVQREIQRMRSQVGEAMDSQARAALPDKLFEDQARKRAALGLIIAELVRSEKIKVDPHRLEETLRNLAEGYENPEQVIKYYQQNQDAMANIEALVLEDQVIDRILEKAKVKDETMSFDQVMNPAKKA